jgi:hypothetical protein
VTSVAGAKSSGSVDAIARVGRAFIREDDTPAWNVILVLLGLLTAEIDRGQQREGWQVQIQHRLLGIVDATAPDVVPDDWAQGDR